MSVPVEADTGVADAAEPMPAERGRYALWANEAGQLAAITRATNLCERCSACGCGDQMEPITLASIMAMGREMIRSNGASARSAIKDAVRTMRGG